MPEGLKREIFEYLDELRDSGEVNMFGAAPYVASEFFLSKQDARQVLLEWMESCKEE
jgi:hypothetical protein